MTLKTCHFVFGLSFPLLWIFGIQPVPSAVQPAAADMLQRAPSHFATFDKLKVHYKSFGKGKQALVFIHGWTCDLSFWRYQVPALARNERLIVVDLPGHGRSDKPEIAYTMELFARSIDSVLRDAGVEKAILAGHSMGAPVIRQFYRLYPAKTQALITVDGALRPYTTNPTEIERHIKPFRAPDYKTHAERVVDSMMSPQTTPALRKEIKNVMLQAPQQVMISAMEGMLDPKIWQQDRIDVPLLVLLAKSSSWAGDYEAFVRRIAGKVDFRVFEGVGHFLMMEIPDAVNASVLEFLSSNHLPEKTFL